MQVSVTHRFPRGNTYFPMVSRVRHASRGVGELARRAREILKGHRILAHHRIQCEQRGGVLTLQGEVPSFYQKQLAQEILRPLADEVTMVNRLQVHPW